MYIFVVGVFDGHILGVLSDQTMLLNFAPFPGQHLQDSKVVDQGIDQKEEDKYDVEGHEIATVANERPSQKTLVQIAVGCADCSCANLEEGHPVEVVVVGESHYSANKDAEKVAEVEINHFIFLREFAEEYDCVCDHNNEAHDGNVQTGQVGWVGDGVRL